MRSTVIAIAVCRCIPLFTVATVVIGCASGRHDVAKDNFSAAAPFSRTIAGSNDAVCWSVKRALLSQGYMVDRPNESGVLTGTRDYQSEPKVNVSVRLQTTCADNRDGTSIVFVTRQSRGKPAAENEADGRARESGRRRLRCHPAPPKCSAS